MELAAQQQALARIYTNTELRERFFADPQTTGRQLKLHPKDVEQLASLSPKQVHFYARSLLRKRMNAVGKLLPLSCRAFGDRFPALFWRYAETQNPQGPPKHHEDAFAFSEFLLSEVHDGLELPWVVDLLCYETASLKAVSGNNRLLIRVFRSQVHCLPRSLVLSNEIPAPLNRPCFAFWLRLFKRKRLLHKVVSLPGFLFPQRNLMRTSL